MGFGTRQPTSNDPPQNTGKSPWLEETDDMDEFALVVNKLAKRCKKCKRFTRTKHLDSNQHCPDCR